MLKKSNPKVSLNIKVESDLDLRLKRARATARAKGLKFNVSAEVITFLEREVSKAEKQLGITQDINEYNSQGDLLV